MNGNRTSESQLAQLIDCLRYRPVATTATQMREAADALEKLSKVAEFAKELSRTSRPIPDTHLFQAVSEGWLCELETALEAAGYGMTEQELEEAL